jgi:hypothetical protein
MSLLSTDGVVLALDPITGDIPDGDLELTGGVEGVAEGARCRVEIVRSECFLDKSIGVPYLETDTVPARDALLGEKFNALKATREIRRAILRTPGVSAVTSLSATRDPGTRHLRIAFTADTIFGDTPSGDIVVGI